MGYCMYQFKTKFRLDKDRVPKAFEDLCCYDNRIRVANEDNEKKYKNIDEVLLNYDWYFDYDLEDNVIDITFDGDKYRGDEEMLNILAPYVEKGSYIVMIGEDSYIWCWYFDGKKCESYNAVLSFNELPELGYISL